MTDVLSYAIPLTDRHLARLRAPEPPEEEAGPTVRGMTYADLAPYLDRMPAVEADLLELACLGCAQSDIAVIMTPNHEADRHGSRGHRRGTAYTQSWVCWATGSAIQRVRYMRWMDSLGIDTESIRAVIERLYPERQREWHVGVVQMIWQFGSQTEVAKRLGKSQGRICWAWRVFIVRVFVAAGKVPPPWRQVPRQGLVQGPMEGIDLEPYVKWIEGYRPGGLRDQRVRRGEDR